MPDLVAAGRLDVSEALLAERAAFVELLGELDASAWAMPTECPEWTVQGVALHVLGDDLSLLSRQRDAATNGLLLFAETHPGKDFRQLLDGFNEQWVTAASFLSDALLVELLRLTGEWSHRLYSETEPEALGEPVGLFAATGPSPYWQIAAREYLERWVHQHQIRRALARPGLGPELLLPAAGAIVRSITANLGFLDAPTGVSVGLSIDRVAAWTIRRSDDGWSLFDGQVPAPDVEVRLGTAEATATLSRGMDAAVELIGQIAEGVRGL